MAPSRYTLDMLRADVERNYGPFVVDLDDDHSATLLPVLRLPQEQRQRFNEMQGRLADLQADPERTDLDAVAAAIRDMLRLVAASDADADRLFAMLPDEPAFVVQLFQAYAERTQPGEASASPS